MVELGCWRCRWLTAARARPPSPLAPRAHARARSTRARTRPASHRSSAHRRRHDDAIAKSSVTPTRWKQRREGERVAHVAAAAGRGETALRGRSAGPPERTDERQLEMPGEVGCLVEASCQIAERVQRYGHHAVRTLQHVGGSGSHQPPQRRGQRAPAVVLERMNDVAQRAVEVAAGTCGSDRIAEPADSRGWSDRRPARGTHAASRGLIERRVAGRAARRQ